MQRVERDNGAGGDAEFGEQGLRRRDLVGLLGDVDMGEHEGGIGSERAQHLGCGAVVEVVEAAAQRLAIQRDAALSGRRASCLQQGGMAAEDRLDRGRIEPLEDVAIAVCAGARRQFRPKAAFSLRRWASMNVTMPRYELPPVTMARMENSST